MSKSMTSGNPFRLILQFAFPLLLGNLLQQTYNIIDAAIVGQILGAKALAGVGASSSIQFFVLGFCMGNCIGFGVPVAKYFGASDYGKMRLYVFNGGVLTAGIAVFVTSVCAVFCSQILHMLSVPEDIFADAYVYLLIIFLGIPFSLLYNYLSSILRAIGDSKTPFMFLAFSAVLNIFLDLFCIVILKLGCAGAAIATISAQAISGILCLIYIGKKVPALWLKQEHCRVKKYAVSELLMMGIPTGMQFSITAIGSMIMQSANNGLGSVYVSGFTAGMKIKQFTMCPFDAVATAASVFCSQNLGAGQHKRIKKGLFCSIGINVAYGILAGIIMIFAGRTLSMMFVGRGVPEILDASAKYLRCMGYFYWSLGILTVARMVTQGLGFSARTVFSGVTEMVARMIVSLFFVGTYGFTAICFTDQTAWVSAVLYIFPTCLWCVRKVTRK